MSKIIRLTESDLIRLVKKVIKEQSVIRPGGEISSPKQYGKAFADALGRNFQIDTYQSYHHEDVPESYASYFIRGLDNAYKSGNDGVSVVLVADKVDNEKPMGKPYRPIKGQVEIRVIFSNGQPTKLGPCFFTTEGKSVSLNRETIMKQIYPKIKDIRYNF